MTSHWRAEPARPPEAVNVTRGQRCWFSVLSGRGRGEYETTVADVSDRQLLVVAPEVRQVAVAVALGARVRVGMRFGSSFYAFTAEVEQQVYEPQLRLGVALPDTMDHQDQRAYYRLPVTVQPHSIAVVHADGRVGDEVRGTIVNVGGGGVEVVMAEPLRSDAVLALRFRLDELEVTSMVQPVAVEPPGPGRVNYRAHCRFLQLPRAVRERIIRVVFRQQLRRTRLEVNRRAA